MGYRHVWGVGIPKFDRDMGIDMWQGYENSTSDRDVGIRRVTVRKLYMRQAYGISTCEWCMGIPKFDRDMGIDMWQGCGNSTCDGMEIIHATGIWDIDMWVRYVKHTCDKDMTNLHVISVWVIFEGYVASRPRSLRHYTSLNKQFYHRRHMKLVSRLWRGNNSSVRDDSAASTPSPDLNTFAF
jgi:hypothetical protein